MVMVALRPFHLCFDGAKVRQKRQSVVTQIAFIVSNFAESVILVAENHCLWLINCCERKEEDL